MLLSACGESGDTPPVSQSGEIAEAPSVSEGSNTEDKPPVLEDIEKRYEETLAKMMARELLHTGDGPVHSEEELAELDRLQNEYDAYVKAQKKIVQQQTLRGQYRTCVDNQDTVCPDLVRYTKKGDRKDKMVMRYGITHKLPEHYPGIW